MPSRLLTALILGAALAAPARAQSGDKLLNRMLDVTPLAGQQVAILPATYVLADPVVESDSAYAPWLDRAAALRLADSVFVGEILARGPEVTWIVPNDLRKMYRRAPGMLTDPDRMGQAMLRNEKMEQVPDQLNASLRRLTAMGGGRMALVPAAIAFAPAPDGIQCTIALALVDARRGTVLWRSRAVGLGVSPVLALRAAAATIFPAP